MSMLDNEYRPMQNAHAFKRLSKSLDIPKRNLAIGEDEIKDSQPVLVFNNAHANMHNFVVMDSDSVPHEQTGITGDGGIITEEDFLTDLYLGYPMEMI